MFLGAEDKSIIEWSWDENENHVPGHNQFELWMASTRTRIVES